MNDTTAQGWIGEPDGRGTWSILSTCILTIVLCCWTSMSPNLPAKSDGKFKIWRYKFDLAFMTVLGSEFVLMVALGQWSSARYSLKKFHKAGYEDWTIQHAFFANMGGFLVEPPEIDLPSFPLDAEQLYTLVREGYVDYPILQEEEIEDKSKSGGLARLFTVAQALWFTLNCVTRFAQGIFVTTLELTTLSFVLVFIITSYCWYHKPMDVNRPITLKLNTSVAAIRRNHHRGPESKWYETPFEYLSRDEWFLARFWRYYIQILHYMHIPLVTQPQRRPYDRIPSHYLLNVDITAEVIATPTIVFFSAMFLIAWNSHFPTAAEKLLWRIASVNSISYALIGGPLSLYFQKTLFEAKKKEERAQARLNRKRAARGWIDRFTTKLRNIHPDQDPELEIPLRALIPISLLCALYCVGRGFILTEDLIGLRSLPKSAFQTVTWSRYVPHW
ncbi:uncharacterized protein N7500_010868 [Penicillium coprophilum]|uniref:uncharacterized protein n=1 Tax=Penicillium coprophilum TaxID=36646 RepID=UPI00238DB0E0|nr:uncharacterized protein N7500_010868 [Penicillium coprophilum]KAJ5150679.1 hypothetical protein N7500_010868 [Penicillium coprophilum]